ncbi:MULTISPECIES: FAD-dependent oxidoreductase [unclassified Nodularia (in: cyanobacteria)]|uniref:NAD(P)/FAD-dependent oxidoreductase n=1 Tax=unclassified Nodularia (in: cyanobacteria) TaxID=2656917 RepID=UPI00187F726F|nr:MULTISPECIES: FAD-dependent oxidoreductase [unclassified Nodularia (in: cyanobacteria)]MBE9197813.1 FAD-binding oxidoreductase [Nodularia sp. LEGE 06071]MCC2695074.1 FAD-binding oxidoreductase [Nodularia sp. LEGE 04288]
MSHVVIIGCGVVGAAIAYELSLVKNLKITVIDRQLPAQASTGAALGVLMGVISHKIKGQAWRRRQTSIQRYETLIPELEAVTNRKIPFNRQGILSLFGSEENVAGWENLAAVRHSQGWELELWDTAKLKNLCPQVDHTKITGAVYSPQDRQLDPTALTLALVEAAQHNGVTCKFGVNVLGMDTPTSEIDTISQCHSVETTEGKIAADWIVVAAGLGSTPLTAQLNQMLDIRPVLGQALHIHLDQPLGNSDFQPVITGNDVHVVPLGGGDYWVGATVEFPSNADEILANPELLDTVWQQAIAFCPDLAPAEIIRTWSGLRPRPEGRPAPVIEPLPGFSNILLATGHYRNGVLLAPATADAIREMIISGHYKK